MCGGQLYKFWYSKQNKNSESFLKTLLRTSRWQHQNIKWTVQLFWRWGLYYHTDHTLIKPVLRSQSVMDREAWHAAVHGVTKSWIWLSDWTEEASTGDKRECTKNIQIEVIKKKKDQGNKTQIEPWKTNSKMEYTN